MSKVKIEGNASGTGTFTIAAPNTNTDYSLTLPETTGGEFVVTDSSGNVGIGTSSIDTKLHIQVSSGDADLKLEDGSGTYMLIDQNSIGGSDVVRFKSGTSLTERMRIDSSGNLLVGTTDTTLYSNTSGTGFMVSAGGRIDVADDTTCANFNRMASDGTIIEFRKAGTTVGSIGVTGSSTSYNTSSDYRLKEDWKPMSGSIDRLKNLNPVNFAWKADGLRVDGFLAHEAAEVVPEAVTGEKDAMRTGEYEVTPAVLDDDGNVVTEAVMGTREVPDYQGIDQSKLVPLLTAALQEAVAKIEALETRIAALEA
jgi:hypothetical protein